MLLAASTQRTIGLVILAIVLVGFVLYVVLNAKSAEPELGSEIELAANRKPYLSDEELEGTKLDLSLGWGMGLLMLIGVGLPLYWLGEPGRQDGLVAFTDRVFADRGAELFEEGANCQQCHGPEGSGGVAGTTITNEAGEFVSVVSWKAPALNTVLSRYSESEVRHVLNFGRNGIMPAWGAVGGGPLTEQQLDYLIFYLRRIQIPEDEIVETVESGVRAGVRGELESIDSTLFTALDEARAEATALVDGMVPGSDEFNEASDEGAALVDAAEADIDAAIDEWLARVDRVVDGARELAIELDSELADRLAAAAGADEIEAAQDAVRRAGLELLSSGDAPNSDLYLDYGEILFNNSAASGTYSCARCHTYGWSFDATSDGPDDEDGHIGPILDTYDDGGGFFGASLTDGSTLTRFETAAGHADFVSEGQTVGSTYGRGGDGDAGQMPGWGPRTDDALGIDYPATLTQDQIDAVVAFERNL
jgi:cytochrome c553